MLLMPIPCAFAPVPSVGPRAGSRVDPDVNPWVDRSCLRARSADEAAMIVTDRILVLHADANPEQP
jgi:hypothetical protein